MISTSWRNNPLVRNERLLHAGMAVLMVFAVACCYIVHCGVAQYVERIASDRAECTGLLKSEFEFTEAFAQAQEQHELLEDEYRSMLERIPAKIVDSEILSSVRGKAIASHCTLIDFRPISTQNHKEFQTRSFDLHLEGRFKSLFQFFESMPRVPYNYQVTRFKVSESSNPSGNCRFDLEMKVVFDHIWAKTE